MRKNKNLALVVASLFLVTLWGCGSNMDSGGDQTGPGTTIADAATVGSDSCKICHTLAHTTVSFPLVGQVAPNSLVIIHECEACHGGGQFHFGTGPILYPKPDAARCATCHTAPVEGVIASGKHTTDSQVSCIACHDPLLADKRLVDGKISCSECHTTLTADQIKLSPFADQIYERFTAGRHTGNARQNACSACHSHEGALILLSQPEKISTKEQIAALTGLPTSGATVKTCATCHDPHTATLRGVGDIKETFTLQSGTPWERTVYSAEFNLCTSCHQVNLKTTWDPTGGYSNAGVIKYELSDVYTKSAANPDPYTNLGIGYHTDSYQGRSFVDTHFKGQLYKKLYYYDATVDYSAATGDGKAILDAMKVKYDDATGPDNIEIVGYNVNPGSSTACSACHDVHGANKILPVGTRVAGYTRDLNDDPLFAAAIAYGKGVGASHGNYMAYPFARNVSATNGDMYASASCTPCHTGREFVGLTVGQTMAEVTAPAPKWNTVSCVSCHNLTVNTGKTYDTMNLASVPRTLPAGYVFSFPATGSVSPTAAELGSSQICFECHKGRTPAGVDVSALPVGPTNHYDISYLHYKPTFAIYYGADAKMVATYAGKTYRGKSTTHSVTAPAVHTYSGVSGAASCVDCHDVHTGVRKSSPSIRSGQRCIECHDFAWNTWNTTGQVGPEPTENNFDRRSSKGDVSATAARLVDTIYAQLMATTNTGFNTNLTAFLTSLQAQSDAAQGKEMVKLRIKERSIAGGWPTKEIAHACASWKVFYYEDKASFAHNRNFARQVMFDAIESLGGDTVGIPTRPL